MTPKSSAFEKRDLMAEAKAVEAAIQASVREALLEHKRAGFPAVGWRDGRVEIVPPEAIDLDALTNGESSVES